MELAEACYKKYVNWEEKNPIKPIIVESGFVSEKYQFGGQIDLYALTNRGFLLGDFKTNSKAIYPEMVYQVAAYEYLLKEQGFNVTDVIILRIGRDDPEGFEEKILTRAELDNGFEIFLRCLDIYNLKKRKPAICTTIVQ